MLLDWFAFRLCHAWRCEPISERRRHRTRILHSTCGLQPCEVERSGLHPEATNAARARRRKEAAIPQLFRLAEGDSKCQLFPEFRGVSRPPRLCNARLDALLGPIAYESAYPDDFRPLSKANRKANCRFIRCKSNLVRDGLPARDKRLANLPRTIRRGLRSNHPRCEFL